MTTTMCEVGKNFKTYHANLLKKFEERQPIPSHDIILPHAAVSFIKDDDVDLKANIEFLRITQKEFPSDVMLYEKLSPNQQKEKDFCCKDFLTRRMIFRAGLNA